MIKKKTETELIVSGKDFDILCDLLELSKRYISTNTKTGWKHEKCVETVTEFSDIEIKIMLDRIDQIIG